MEDKVRALYPLSFPKTLQHSVTDLEKLYIKGTLYTEDKHKFLCIVGSRMSSDYGRRALEKLLPGLVGYPISIVSGLAIGIDSIAHEVALDVGLHCVAFPGSSLAWSKIYPPSHVGLARRILEKKGALLSPWHFDYPTGRWAFPVRNRLMAGISHATLVIEAAERSGSLITAEYALSFGREVLAVPGSIFATNSYGTHMLIRSYGPALVHSSVDILEGLGFERPTSASISAEAYERLDELSKKVYDAVRLGGATMDSLIEGSRAPVASIIATVSSLEIQRLIVIRGASISAA